MDLKNGMEFNHKLLETYGEWCKPLCKELQIPRTAFDILMFLANNPMYHSARDIVEIRGIKANLVSVNVDKLVQEGLLERIPDAEDRRKTILRCTEQAETIIAKGRQVQEEFFRKLLEGIDPEVLHQLGESLKVIRENLYRMRKEEI